MESLQHIGFNDWFQARIEADKLALHEIARGAKGSDSIEAKIR